MNRPAPLVLPLAFALVLASACGPLKVQTPSGPAGSAKTLVTLLPDADTGRVGKAVVSNAHGSVELSEARASSSVDANAAPGAPVVMSEGEVRRLFGDALSALPPAPRHFTLFFRFESEELTDDSRRLVQEVLSAVKTRPEPDVVAIGHTDTTGSAAMNIELGLRRANAVRALLVDGGLPASSIEVTSHGEAELLVPTADGVFEPRNRRVEITVR